MTLKELLSTLDASKITASIYEPNGTTLIAELKAATYESLDDTIESRKVIGWQITNATAIKVTLSEETATNDTKDTSNGTKETITGDGTSVSDKTTTSDTGTGSTGTSGSQTGSGN